MDYVDLAFQDVHGMRVQGNYSCDYYVGKEKKNTKLEKFCKDNALVMIMVMVMQYWAQRCGHVIA